MDLETFAKFVINVVAVVLVLNAAIALYGLLARPNLLKKIIALTIFSDSINSFAILIGFRLVKGFENPVPPVITSVPPSESYARWFLAKSVDPLPQALVLTAIVINLAVTAFLVALAIQIYRVSGTLDARTLAYEKARRGEER